MLDFGSHLTFSKNFFKVDGFDKDGLPIIVGVFRDSAKILATQLK
jgi:hypothetical protein